MMIRLMEKKGGCHVRHANQERIIREAARFARAVHEQNSSGHDWWHVMRVTRLSRLLSVMEGADAYLCELASLLHDVADEKLNASKEVGLHRVQRWLEEAGTAPADRKHVLDIIGTMSFAGGSGQAMKTLEGAIVQDADRLDALGFIGIARTFAYSGWKGQGIYDPAIPVREGMTRDQYRHEKSTAINHFSEKLLKLKDRMNTDTGRMLAAGRHQLMELFLNGFDKEWGFGNERYLLESPLHRSAIARVHVTFDESAAGSLRLALRNRNRQGEMVIALPDDFMVGPLPRGCEGTELRERHHWLLSRFAVSEKEHDGTRSMLIDSTAAWLTWPDQWKDTECVIWASDSASEQLGLRRLMTLLPDEAEVFVVNPGRMLSDLYPQIDYRRTGEIVPDKLEPLLEDGPVKLTLQAKSDLRADWERLLLEDGCLRIVLDGQLCTVEESHYDAFILACADAIGARDGRFLKSARVIGEVIGKADQYISDTFIAYRVRQLIRQGKFRYTGHLDAMRHYSVSLSDAALAAIPDDEPRIRHCTTLRTAAIELAESRDHERRLLQELEQLDPSSLYRLLPDDCHADIDEFTEQLKKMQDLERMCARQQASLQEAVMRLSDHLGPSKSS